MSQASYASCNHDAMSGRLQRQQQDMPQQQQQKVLCRSSPHCFMGPVAAIKGEIIHHCFRSLQPMHGGLCGTRAENALPNERTPRGSLVSLQFFAGLPFAE
jgi:hypothetical protein